MTAYAIQVNFERVLVFVCENLEEDRRKLKFQKIPIESSRKHPKIIMSKFQPLHTI